MYSRDNSPRPTKNAEINVQKSQRNARGNVYQRGRYDDSPSKRTVYTQSPRQSGNYNAATPTVLNPPPDYSGTAIRYAEQEDIYTEDTVTRYPIQNESESEFDYESDIAFPNDEKGKDKANEFVKRSRPVVLPLDPIIHSRRAHVNDNSKENTKAEDMVDEYKVDDMIKLLKNAEIDGEDMLLCAIIIMLLSSGCEEEIIMILAFLLFSHK